jgi:hypothetical protein
LPEILADMAAHAEAKVEILAAPAAAEEEAPKEAEPAAAGEVKEEATADPWVHLDGPGAVVEINDIVQPDGAAIAKILAGEAEVEEPAALAKPEAAAAEPEAAPAPAAEEPKKASE